MRNFESSDISACPPYTQIYSGVIHVKVLVCFMTLSLIYGEKGGSMQ